MWFCCFCVGVENECEDGGECCQVCARLASKGRSVLEHHVSWKKHHGDAFRAAFRNDHRRRHLFHETTDILTNRK